MARILAVDDDALARAVLMDVLGGLGHEVVGASGGNEALKLAGAATFDLVITDILMPEVDGFELAARIGRLPTPIPVVLSSGFYRGDAEAQAKTAGIAVVGFLPKPVQPDNVAAVVRSVLGPRVSAARTADPDRALEWSGAAFLAGLEGPIERVPPMRVLFLCHRVAGSGAVLIELPEVQASVVVRAGRIIHVEGVPGLLKALDPRLRDHRHLGQDIAAAVAAGNDVQRALESAEDGLGDFLTRSLTARGGLVRFDPHAVPPPGAFPLPSPIPRLVSGALRRGRPIAQITRDWDALEMAAIHVRIPDDSPESRWGLDPTAMRVVRIAGNAKELGPLVSEASGSSDERRAEVLRAIDLLYLLGILLVDGGPLETSNTETGSLVVSRDGATEEDPRVVRLRNALTLMEGQAPVDVLELGDRKAISDEEVTAGYREISKRFHPDNFFSAPPLIRALSEACFSKVNAAYEALRMPAGLADARRLLDARSNGRQFITARDHQAARVAFRRGEVLFRNRDWRGADALFLEAVKLDAATWPHGLYSARCGYLSRRITYEAAITEIDALQVPDPVKRAELSVAVGIILKLEGRHAEALRRFKDALEKDPENRDAMREVRLHGQRNTRVETPSTASLGSSIISNLLRRKT